MKKTIKNGAVLSLAALLTLGLASCATDDNKDSNNTSNDTTTSTDTSTGTDTTPVTPDPVLPATYTVSYNLNGGAYAEGQSNPANYKENTEDITLVNPTKAGYEFAGWHKDTADGEVVTKITKDTKSNLTLVAAWKAIENLKVTFAFAGTETFDKTTPVNMKIVNNGKETYKDVLTINFGETNTTKKLVLENAKLGDADVALEEVTDGDTFLGYKLNVEVKAGQTVDFTATAKAALGTYSFSCTTASNKTSEVTSITFKEEIKAQLSLTQEVATTFENSTPFKLTVKNSGNGDFDDVVSIRFQESVTDEEVSLSEFKLGADPIPAENVTKVVTDGTFLGYDVKVNVKVNEEKEINATLTTKVTKTYKIKTTTTDFTSNTSETKATYKEPIVAPTSVTIAKVNEEDDNKLYKEETLALKAVVAGEGNYDQAVIWEIKEGDTVVSLVSDGLNATVTAKGLGEAVILCKSATGEVSGEYTVVVEEKIVTPEEIAPTTVTVKLTNTEDDNKLFAEETLSLTAVLTGKEGFVNEVTWSIVSGSEFISINPTGLTAVVTANAVGTATVIATSKVGEVASEAFTIVVEAPAVVPGTISNIICDSFVSLEWLELGDGYKELSFNPGEWVEIEVTVTDELHEIDTVTMSKGSVTHVSGNLYRFTFEEGEHEITITTKEKAPVIVAPTKITVAPVSTSDDNKLYADETLNLKATVEGKGNYDETVVWSVEQTGTFVELSSDGLTATVTAKAVGTATVKATSTTGEVFGSYSITVEAKAELTKFATVDFTGIKQNSSYGTYAYDCGSVKVNTVSSNSYASKKNGNYNIVLLGSYGKNGKEIKDDAFAEFDLRKETAKKVDFELKMNNDKNLATFIESFDVEQWDGSNWVVVKNIDYTNLVKGTAVTISANTNSSKIRVIVHKKSDATGSDSNDCTFQLDNFVFYK